MRTFKFLLAASCALSPLMAHACWDEAGQRFGVPPALLVAIGRTESSLNPVAVNRSHLAQTHTVDIGLMQVNSDPRTLRRLGVAREELFQPCPNIRAGARILAEKFRRYGPTWEAVGAYNAACVRLSARQCRITRARYAWRVYRQMLAPIPVKPRASRPPSVPPLQLVSLP